MSFCLWDFLNLHILILLILELVSALSEKFENVKCEVEQSADFFPSPYRLSFTKVGKQLCMVPTADWPDVLVAIKEHMNGNGATLGVIQVSLFSSIYSFNNAFSINIEIICVLNSMHFSQQM